MGIISLGNRSLSPLAELFIDTMRALAGYARCGGRTVRRPEQRCANKLFSERRRDWCPIAAAVYHSGALVRGGRLSGL